MQGDKTLWRELTKVIRIVYHIFKAFLFFGVFHARAIFLCGQHNIRERKDVLMGAPSRHHDSI